MQIHDKSRWTDDVLAQMAETHVWEANLNMIINALLLKKKVSFRHWRTPNSQLAKISTKIIPRFVNLSYGNSMEFLQLSVEILKIRHRIDSLHPDHHT